MFGQDRRAFVVDHVEGHHRDAARGELARDAHVGVAREGVVRPAEQRRRRAGRADRASPPAPRARAAGRRRGSAGSASTRAVEGAASLGGAEAQLLRHVLELRAARLASRCLNETTGRSTFVVEAEGLPREEGQALGQRADAGVHLARLHRRHVAEVRQEEVVDAPCRAGPGSRRGRSRPGSSSCSPAGRRPRAAIAVREHGPHARGCGRTRRRTARASGPRRRAGTPTTCGPCAAARSCGSGRAPRRASSVRQATCSRRPRRSSAGLLALAPVNLEQRPPNGIAPAVRPRGCGSRRGSRTPCR